MRKINLQGGRKMKYCSNCYAELEDSVQFCPECGQAVTSKAAEMKKENEENQNIQTNRPYYQDNTYIETEKRRVNGFGIASFVLGITGLLFVCCGGIGSFIGAIGLVLGILGIVLLKDSSKGLAVAGTVLNGIALAIGLCFLLMGVKSGIRDIINDNKNSNTIDTVIEENVPIDIEEKEPIVVIEDISEPDVKVEIKNDLDEERSLEEEEVTEENTEAKAEETEPERDENGINIQMKNFLDSYEKFIDQYVEFMKNYDVSDLSALNEYSKLMSKYYDFLEETEKYADNEEEMTIADQRYYTEVMLRIEQKLLDATIDLQY